MEPWIDRLCETLVKRFDLDPKLLEQITTKIEIAAKKEVPENKEGRKEDEGQEEPILSAHPYDYPPLSLIKGLCLLSHLFFPLISLCCFVSVDRWFPYIPDHSLRAHVT